MAATAKKKPQEFIVMRRTRAMLNDLWDHWRQTLGHTPDTAKRMMVAAIREMHQVETASLKKAATQKKVVKKTLKKAVSGAGKKTKTTRRKTPQR